MQKFFQENPQINKQLKDENEELTSMLYDVFEKLYFDKEKNSYFVRHWDHFDIAAKLKSMGLIQKEPIYFFNIETQSWELQ